MRSQPYFIFAYMCKNFRLTISVKGQDEYKGKGNLSQATRFVHLITLLNFVTLFISKSKHFIGFSKLFWYKSTHK